MRADRSVSLTILAAIILLAGFYSAAIGYSETEERQICYSHSEGGLLIEIEAPVQVWPGDEIDVVIRANASIAIAVDFIKVDIHCLKENLTEALISQINFLDNVDLEKNEVKEKAAKASVPQDALPGLIYGTLSRKWQTKEDSPTHVDGPENLQVTFVQNKAYEELRLAYEELSSSFDDLQANHTSLQANHTELLEEYEAQEQTQVGEGNATGLMYLFLITTAIFIVTTILLLIKRPKSSTW